MSHDVLFVRELHETSAILSAEDPDYMPIFERMEVELAEAEAAAANDPVTQARKRREALRAGL